MKALVFERRDNGRVLIHKPQTGYDDMIDSFVMCFSPMVDDSLGTQLMLV